MALTEVDVWALKTRIKDILANDTTLAAYFKKFHVGAPEGGFNECNPKPFLFVTNDEGLIIEDDEASTVQNDEPKTSTQIIHLLIGYLDKANKGSKVEKKLDDITKTIKETLKENYHLKHPTLANDPKAFRSYPEEVRPLNPEMLGKETQGRAIFFKVTAYTS